MIAVGGAGIGTSATHGNIPGVAVGAGLLGVGAVLVGAGVNEVQAGAGMFLGVVRRRGVQ
jgi:hypothetical protein